MRFVKLLQIRTPAARDAGYTDMVGKTVEVTGNAYHGFQFKLPSGERRDLFHYTYAVVS